MAHDPITVLSWRQGDPRGTSPIPGRLLGVEVPVWGLSVCLQVAATDEPARLADIVPVAREIATRTAACLRGQLRRGGVHVPCRKGCAACCRHLVSLAPPEAFRLVEELQSLPPIEQVWTRRAFRSAERKVLQGGRPAIRPYRRDKAHLDRQQEREAFRRWYHGLQVDCPLLCGRLCLWYDRRPVCCRAHIVCSDPHYCRPTLTSLGTKVRMPFSLTQALCDLAAEMEQAPRQAVLMPMALRWALDNWPRARRTWPADVLVARFFDLLRRHAARAEPDAA